MEHISTAISDEIKKRLKDAGVELIGANEFKRRCAEREKASIQRWEEDNRRRKIMRIQRLQEKSGIGRRFKNRTFENYTENDNNQKVKTYCMNYVMDFDRQEMGIYLCGKQGIGKTLLAAAIVNALVKREIPALFIGTMNLDRLVKDTYNNRADMTAGQVIDEIVNNELVVLDDLGKEAEGEKSDHARQLMKDIINRLYENETKVIITSNLEPYELPYDESIQSRITEMCDMISYDDRDWRLKNEKERQ